MIMMGESISQIWVNANIHCLSHYVVILAKGILQSINPYKTNGFSHRYHLGESTFIFGGHRSGFNFFPFVKFSLSKQNSPRWDAALCGVTSGAILFACVPQKGRQA